MQSALPFSLDYIPFIAGRALAISVTSDIRFKIPSLFSRSGDLRIFRISIVYPLAPPYSFYTPFSPGSISSCPHMSFSGRNSPFLVFTLHLLAAFFGVKYRPKSVSSSPLASCSLPFFSWNSSLIFPLPVFEIDSFSLWFNKTSYCGSERGPMDAPRTLNSLWPSPSVLFFLPWSLPPPCRVSIEALLYDSHRRG